jgi:hypothetical protein
MHSRDRVLVPRQPPFRENGPDMRPAAGVFAQRTHLHRR